MAFEFDNDYASNIAEGVVLMDCWAEWCMPCGILAPIIDELAEEFSDRAIVGKLNVDNNQNAATSLSIRSLPTIIIFKDGQEVNRLIGLRSKEDLAKALEEQLGE